ncbi:ANTAR domain-containing protein [Streptomyces fodineus]|uniref:ANTAR domain-containing protein n=1 Tax=Streptomyces fodineus TaxID=1904616 RepID=UPI000ADC622A
MAFFALSRHQPLLLLSCTRLVSEYDRLTNENDQLRTAVSSHAVIDQAIGAVVVLGQIAPEEAWRALRDVSQRTNTKLRTLAGHILDYAQGGTLPEPERIELGRAIVRYRRYATDSGEAPTTGSVTARLHTPVPVGSGAVGRRGPQDPSVLDLVEAVQQDAEDGEQKHGDGDHGRIPLCRLHLPGAPAGPPHPRRL